MGHVRRMGRVFPHENELRKMRKLRKMGKGKSKSSEHRDVQSFYSFNHFFLVLARFLGALRS